MSAIGPVRAPQPIPDPNLLNPAIGQRQSSATFFLRSTPPIFTVLNVGGSNTNQDFAFRPAAIPDYLQFIPDRILAPRFSKGARPSGQTVTFDVSVAGQGVVVAALSMTKALAAAIAGTGTLTGNFVRSLRSLVASLSGSGAVAADQSGGTLGSNLTLTPEDPSDTLTLTEETGEGLTLTPEDPSDSLPLTPA